MLSTQGITLTTSESLELIAYPAINERPFLAWRPQVKVTVDLPLRVAEAYVPPCYSSGTSPNSLPNTLLYARGGQHFCLPSDKR